LTAYLSDYSIIACNIIPYTSLDCNILRKNKLTTYG